MDANLNYQATGTLDHLQLGVLERKVILYWPCGIHASVGVLGDQLVRLVVNSVDCLVSLIPSCEGSICNGVGWGL